MNPLLVVVPVCKKDVDLVLGNLERCIKLDGKVSHPAIVSYDSSFGHERASEVLKLAGQYFSDVTAFCYQSKPDTSWPYTANVAWQSAARFIEQKSLTSVNNPFHGARAWFWWEGDACPLRAGWIDAIEIGHERSKKPFYGHVSETDKHMNGVAVYPFLISNYAIKAMLVRSTPFDYALSAEAKIHIAPANDVILHRVKKFGGEKPIPISTEEIEALPKTAVLFHGVFHSDIPISATEPEASIEPAKGFYMSGDIGDLIYALPLIRSMGGGGLYLGPEQTHIKKCREPFSKERFENIAPLIRIQPYIKSVNYAPAFPADKIRHDINQFREYFIKDFDLKKSLCHVMLEAFNQPVSESEQAWLNVDKKDFRFPVIIARSPRCQEKSFPWKKVLKKYIGSIGFVGTPEEHQAFVNSHGFVPYVSTPTLLDLARVIAAAKLFIGNQSAPYAIAEALKKDTIQETWSHTENCVFIRPNAVYVRAGEKNITLPDISKEKMADKRLVIHGHVDGFSGYGQAIGHFVRQLTLLKHHVDVLPTAVSETLAPIPDHFKRAVVLKSEGPRMVFHTYDAFPALLRKGDAVFTMWESTMIDKVAVDALNERARVLIVPGVWNASCFSAAGVNVPIRIVHLGIDLSVFSYRENKSKSNATVFGTAGRFAHGGSRKGLEEVVEAFREAFPTESDVRLRVKLFKDCNVPETDDPRITFDREFLTAEQLSEWYAGLTAFISASKGEGWGLHHLQAMAVGRPIACATFSGVTEFFDSSVGYPLDYELKECDGFYDGKGLWGVPKKESIIETMQHIRKNKVEASHVGVRAAERAKLFTWEAAAKKLEAVLTEFDLL